MNDLPTRWSHKSASKIGEMASSAAPHGLSWLLTGLVATVVAALGTACNPGDPSRCFDVCGPGTQCVEAKCVPAENQAEGATTGDVPPASDKVATKRRKKGKSSGSSDESADASGELAAGEVPALVDDSRVPSFDPNATTTIDLEAGSEKLSDSVIRTHMGKLSGAFNKCIADAALRSGEDLGSGEVEFDFGVGGNGRVTGVTARGPKKLAAAGGMACLRVAIHSHRFPIFDGPVMAVHSSLPYD